MKNTGGPVVVGMEPATHEDAHVLVALDAAAREARRRRVDLRLVYGRDTLSTSWTQTCQMLDGVVRRAEAAHPGLAVTTAIYPGSMASAVTAAAATASLVVLPAEVRPDETAPPEARVIRDFVLR